MFVDSAGVRRYALHGWGKPVKRFHWTLLLCLLGMLLLSVVPPVDAPETAFNEMDLPLTVSHANLPRVTLSPPAAQTLAIPYLSVHREELNTPRLISRFEPTVKSPRPSLQPLLCTFLI